MKMNMEQKQKGFFIVHKEDVLVRLAPLNDAQFRLHFVNVAQADFKDGPDRKTGTINATFSQMLAGPLQTWSKSTQDFGNWYYQQSHLQSKEMRQRN